LVGYKKSAVYMLLQCKDVPTKPLVATSQRFST